MSRRRDAARLVAALALSAATACSRQDASAAIVADGVNRHPVHLVRPRVTHLSPVAELGRALFFDGALSASGRSSCASCHMPDRAYAAGSDSALATGGRMAPSLRYVDRTPRFHIGPDLGVSDQSDSVVVPATSSAIATPHGGLFWDGRAGTLQSQAMGPLFNPAEMANESASALAARLRARYGARFAALFGAETVAPDDRFVAEVTFAIARYQFEDSTFHPYDSKYDAYLEGKATLTPSEARGLAVFEDSTKGNCVACHLDRPTADMRPPVFSDYEYEAVGVPRNTALAANRNSQHFDLGLCGPLRADLAAHPEYCGMFRTPSLRNVALRRAFFHNGAIHTLDDAVAFYAFRDTHPERVYPRGAKEMVMQFNDLPAIYRHNVDVVTAPFGRKRGDALPMTPGDIQDVVSFLKTLTDGHRR